MPTDVSDARMISKVLLHFWLQAKVKLAKLVVDVLPGEVGLRLLVNIFPEKIQVVFDGLLNSYKVQYLEYTNVWLKYIANFSLSYV